MKKIEENKDKINKSILNNSRAIIGIVTIIVSLVSFVVWGVTYNQQKVDEVKIEMNKTKKDLEESGHERDLLLRELKVICENIQDDVKEIKDKM